MAQSLVDLRDVADAAVVLLTEDGLDGGTFEAVGPELADRDEPYPVRLTCTPKSSRIDHSRGDEPGSNCNGW